jgi:3-hydroxyacyl-CoA dehydrogenase/enoyl-CoA hydratase/3-hydroxybutyryl-CoA epimerase
MAANVDLHEVPQTLENLYAAGYTGAGEPCFYRDARGRDFDESVMEHIARRPGPTPSPEDARDMLLLAMVNEAFRCLDAGVLRDIASMELGAVLGIGFPHCWHGPARYASQLGIARTRDRLAELHRRYGIAQLAPAPAFDRFLACGVDGGLA